MFRGYRAAVLTVAILGSTGAALAADQWIAPTKEELQMTAFDKAPGASAVILNYEEQKDDALHMDSYYMRIKILNEEGRKYADREMISFHGSDGWAISIDDVQGRTIHPDGTIIPYTGKPYEKVMEKSKENKYTAKVMTLPDVTVGSIIEFRYKRRWDDNWYTRPEWYVQKDLYVVKSHYAWKPINRELNFSNGSSNARLAYTPILPKGAVVKQTTLPAVAGQNGQLLFETTVNDVPPIVEEEYMPPVKSFAYRVFFYYTAYTNTAEYWEKEGKDWSKSVDKFIGNSAAVRTFATTTTAGATTPQDKLKKLYAAVMSMENTDFTRTRSTAEDKVAGLKAVKTADDILTRKRGSSDDLTALFIALARSLGMKAYAMEVVRRDDRIFMPAWYSFGQFDDMIAIVNIDGKDNFYDPGQKYVPFGHLDWKHTFAGGIRQTDQGVKIADCPSETFQANQIQRVADLKIEPNGTASGILRFTYIGAAAERWRQRAERTDETELKRDLKDSVEAMLPDGMEVEVTSIDALKDYEQPLKVSLKASGPLGTATSKRVILPSDVFEAKTKPAFPHEKREQPVYFSYEVSERDAVRYVLPSGLKIESSPLASSEKFQTFMIYNLKADVVANSITTRRDLFRNTVIFKKEEYPELKTFYGKLQEKDKESIVLSVSTPVASN